MLNVQKTTTQKYICKGGPGTQTHLFVSLLLSAFLQSESSQLIGSLLHQVDVADGIGQGFDDI